MKHNANANQQKHVWGVQWGEKWVVWDSNVGKQYTRIQRTEYLKPNRGSLLRGGHPCPKTQERGASHPEQSQVSHNVNTNDPGGYVSQSAGGVSEDDVHTWISVRSALHR